MTLEEGGRYRIPVGGGSATTFACARPEWSAGQDTRLRGLVLLRALPRAERCQPHYRREQDHGDDRPLGMREEHPPADLQSDVRSHTRYPCEGLREDRPRGDYDHDAPSGASAPRRDGIPAGESVPDVDL